MRPLKEIVDAVQAGEEPTYDELFYAVSVLHNLMLFDFADLQKAQEAGEAPMTLLREHCLRVGGAFKYEPQRWLGDDNDPRNPEFQERRAEHEAAKRRILH